jgi:sensor domain CHASE-containing protein
MELGIAVKGYRSDEDVLGFLQSRDPTNLESELSESYFAGVKANALAVLDKNGNLLWGRGFDLGKAEFTALPSGLESQLAS